MVQDTCKLITCALFPQFLKSCALHLRILTGQEMNWWADVYHSICVELLPSDSRPFNQKVSAGEPTRHPSVCICLHFACSSFRVNSKTLLQA